MTNFPDHFLFFSFFLYFKICKYDKDKQYFLFPILLEKWKIRLAEMCTDRRHAKCGVIYICSNVYQITFLLNVLEFLYLLLLIQGKQIISKLFFTLLCLKLQKIPQWNILWTRLCLAPRQMACIDFRTNDACSYSQLTLILTKIYCGS